ncbi:hypothetical protein [Vibrio sp. D431a]|uniref:hypothetical protein n=1 Tax=Vibrio sp. D431a TaxID=2837388 RepID=UPI0025545CB3|nr:hypothetical protein [Vibrio sp. D431a]MDK9790679.1 hypothetical protein [Vibrio sp. D431a]
MRYKSITAAFVAALASANAFAAPAGDFKILGDDISIVEVEQAKQPVPPVYPQKQINDFVRIADNSVQGTLADKPAFFIGIGIHDNRGIGDNLESEDEIKVGGSFHIGLQAEKWDVRGEYSSSSADFNNVTGIQTLGANAMYRAFDNDFFKVKTGLGYDLMMIDGDKFDAVKDGKKEKVDELKSQSAYAALDVSSAVTKKISVGATIKYHVFKDDHAINFRDYGKADVLVDDISYDLRASYQITNNLGLSLMTTFGSEFQKSSGIELTLGF